VSIAIGSDEGGFDLKERIIVFLRENGYVVKDFGVYDREPVLYADIAFDVAKAIIAGEHERGILICGTGIGMAISANKVKGIRAATCHDVYSAERARKSNNAQVMTLGAKVVGEELALSLVAAWLGSEFEDGRSSAKVARITAYEEEHWREVQCKD